MSSCGCNTYDFLLGLDATTRTEHPILLTIDMRRNETRAVTAVHRYHLANVEITLAREI